MRLDAVLDQLENTQWLRRSLDDDPTYLFKHALLQDAAYDSLLKHDRKRLHQAVGDALERLYPEQLDELAPLLARHFEEADDDPRALSYLILAGERATRQHARHEAVAHFSSALEIAPRVHAPLAKLYRARGLAYEALGDYEQARADQEAALESARATDDRRAEWQALIDLGKLWAERDYGKTGEYFQRAYDLARAIGDSATLAHSLNRVGNWYANIERPMEAIRCHDEALAIFQKLEDRRGIAQTLDLLGTSHGMRGDLIQAAENFRQAIPLLRELDERVVMASGLATLALGSAGYQVRSVVLPPRTIADGQSQAEAALQIARETGWRSAEAFALTVLAMCQGACGDFTSALESAQRSLDLATEIGHRQWMAFAYGTLGEINVDLQALTDARHHVERGLELGKAINSWLWVRTMSGFLASLLIRQNDLARAESVLDASPAPDDPPHTLAQQVVYSARAELALARGEPARALEIIDQLIASAAHAKPDGSNILGVSMLRGQVLAALGKFAEGETALFAARAIADAQGALPLQWRIHAALGKLYRAQGDEQKAADAFAGARVIVDKLSRGIADEALRKRFEEGTREFF
jgi:tetratricopeptide (TPR) repeat protein